MQKPVGKQRDINDKPLMEPIPHFMDNRHSHEQGRKLENRVRFAVAHDLNETPIDFVPSPDEVARRAYLNYVNQGAQPGNDVQHWLEAEKQLLAERNLTRVHGFHNRT